MDSQHLEYSKEITLGTIHTSECIHAFTAIALTLPMMVESISNFVPLNQLYHLFCTFVVHAFSDVVEDSWPHRFPSQLFLCLLAGGWIIHANWIGHEPIEVC